MKTKKFPKTLRECEKTKDCTTCGYLKELSHKTRKGKKVWDGYQCIEKGKLKNEFNWMVDATVIETFESCAKASTELRKAPKEIDVYIGDRKVRIKKSDISICPA